MSDRIRQRLVLSALLLFGAVVFLTGIDWGLPSRAVDPYLFGSRTPWTGAQLLELAPDTDDPHLGADVDVNPIAHRHQPIVLNHTDQQRAEIVRRYRLFSYQPDEMITFDALAGMNPSALELDPKLYQYGGLWIYPVGALLKIGSMLGVVTLRDDLAYYLDHPQAFGRFYVVARAYSAAWGLVGIWAVFRIVRHASASLVAATGAAATYLCLPVVVNMTHEAKPHLPGAVLMLLAILAARTYVARGSTRSWVATSALCGAAAGMVLSAAVIFILLPLMTLLRPDAWSRRIRITLLGVLLGAGVYFITNPYVAINLVANRDILRSNFANTVAMYEAARLGEGFVNAIKLMREGASLGVAIFGAVALVVLVIRAKRAHPLAWLIGAPALIVTLQFVALAAGKPGEYGRFALLPAVALAIAAACAIPLASRRAVDRIAVVTLMVAFAAFPSWFYLLGFVHDASPRPRRLEDAHWASLLQQAGATKLALFAEPAPYSLPPVNLFDWQLILLPRGFEFTNDPTDAHVIIRAVDTLGPNGAELGGFVRHSTVSLSDRFPTRISWADKPFEVWVGPHVLERLR